MRLSALVVFLLAGCEVFAQTYPGAAWETLTPQAAGFDPVKFQAAMNAMPSPAVVTRYGKIVGTKGDPARSRYTLSAGKSLTALIFGTLLQRGLVSLDATVPGSDNPSAPLATFRHFLTMTSDYHLTPHNPGQHYAYNNNAVSFYGEHMNSRWFAGLDKIGMLKRAFMDTLQYQDPIGFTGTVSGWGGGWALSSRDLARVGYLVLREGNWRGEQLVPRGFIQALYSNQIPSGATAGGTGSGDFDNETGTSALLYGHYSFGFWLAGGVKLPAVMMSGAQGTRCFVVPSRELVLASAAADGGVKIPESVVNMFIDAIVSSPVQSPDTTAPSVSITAPASGATVSGTVQVSASASDNVGVAGVTFLLDGTPIGAEDTSAPYGVSWNASASASGSHTLAARARDTSGNVRTASITLSVAAAAAPPAVSRLVLVNADNDTAVAGFDPLPDGAVLNLAALPSRRLNILAVTSPSVTGSVRFTLNGSVFRMENTAPYAMAGDASGDYAPWTPGVGTYTLAATAYSGSDAGGSAGVPLTRSFSVVDQPVAADTTAPAVSIASPANGASVGGIVTVTVNASDNRGVAGVQLLLDGTSLWREELQAPYTFAWDTAGLSGAHTLTARARDAAGNSAASAPVSVSVNGGQGQTAPAITGLTLINADTDAPVAGFDPLPNGAALRLSSLPPRLNVRANVAAAPAGSVTFALDGNAMRTENTAPFALAGDASGDYAPWTPTAGAHTLTVTPYAGAGASGAAGAAYTITFTVTQ